MEKKLNELKNGEKSVIISIEPPPSKRRYRSCGWGFKKRLEDMGITPGTRITVIKSAPFYGPVEIEVRGSRLAIGRELAKKILVDVEK